MEKTDKYFNPTLILRLEGVACFFLSLYLFHHFQGSWWLFTALFFVPDISLIGYQFGPRNGSIFYNVMHSEFGSLLLAACSLAFGVPLLLQLAIIWFCHVNFDRMLGIGLKYSDEFKHTHLGTISYGKRVKK